MSELPIADFRLAIEDRALRQPVACHSKSRNFRSTFVGGLAMKVRGFKADHSKTE
jgi:hypothetical protein